MQSTIPIKVLTKSNQPKPLGRLVNNFSFVENKISIKLIALLGFSLSLSIILFDPVINRDGVLYLFTAETFLQSGFSAALQIYPWPFFSVLIATISQTLSLSLHASSHIVVVLCFFITSYAFVRLVAEMGGSKTAQIFALIIILFHPLLADYRSSSVRDPGMWGFMLLSLLELLRYSKKPSLKHQFKWIIFITIAFLFRVEAFVIAVVSPLSLLLIDRGSFLKRVVNTLRFISIPAVLLSFIAILFLFFSPAPVENFKLLKDLDYYAGFFSHIANTIDDKSSIISKELLIHTAKEDSYYAVISVFFTVFSLNIIRAITPIYLLVMAFHLMSKARLQLSNNTKVIVTTYLFILSIYLFLFTVSRQFNLERYSFQIVVILLLYLPFILENLWKTTSYKFTSRSIIVLVLVLYALDTVVNSDYKKSYINQAAIWLQAETNDADKVISNHHHIAFFGDKQTHRVEDLFLERETIQRQWIPGIVYAYHAENGNEAALRTRIEHSSAKIIKEFRGKDKGIVIVFKLLESK